MAKENDSYGYLFTTESPIINQAVHNRTFKALRSWSARWSRAYDLIIGTLSYCPTFLV